MIKVQESNQVERLTKAEARGLTNRIRNAVEDIRKLVAKAHEGKAWKVLGYGTWEEYVKAEFGMSRQRSYQLLDQGRIIEAIEDAAGDLSTMVDKISERDARAIKDKVPEIKQEIQSRVNQGQEPDDAAAAAIGAAKEKAKAEREAKQAQNKAFQEQSKAALPDHIKAREDARNAAMEARKAKPVDVDALMAEIDELREANAALEKENAALKAENAKWEAMRVQWEAGGFEEVIAGKDEEIRVLKTRVETESRDKAGWKRSSDYFRAEAVKLGYSRDAVIDIETGEFVNG